MNSTSSCGQADQITFQHLLLASGCFSLSEYNVQIQTAFNTRCQLGLSVTTSRQSSNIRENLPIVSDELHIVSLVTLLDAVHTDGVAVCCVTGVTPVGNPNYVC